MFSCHSPLFQQDEHVEDEENEMAKTDILEEMESDVEDKEDAVDSSDAESSKIDFFDVLSRISLCCNRLLFVQQDIYVKILILNFSNPPF